MAKDTPIFKEEIVWEGKKYLLEVFDNNNYSKIKNIRQVSGFIFNEKGELLIVKCHSSKPWSLPGGGPEKIDKTWKDTLIREVEEEADVEIQNIQPAGYIQSTSIGEKKTAKTGIAIRAVAKVKKIKPQTIDIATGRIGKRKFIPVSDFLKYCPWGRNGQAQLDIALKTLPINNSNNDASTKIMAIIYSDKGKYLLLKTNPKTMREDHWYVVTGSVEEGESFEEAVKREVKEETSLEILNIQPTALSFDYSWPVNSNNLKHEEVFLVKVHHAEPKLSAWEHVAFKWLSKADFIGQIHWYGDNKHNLINLLKQIKESY